MENAQFDPKTFTKDKDGKKVDTDAPYGDCIVDCNGDLYSVHDLKHELVGSQTGKIVVTLDCCRDKRGVSKRIVTLRLTSYHYNYLLLKKEMKTEDEERLLVIQGTSDLHSASDSNSFTKELHKVYGDEGKSIPILEIPK